MCMCTTGLGRLHVRGEGAASALDRLRGHFVRHGSCWHLLHVHCERLIRLLKWLDLRPPSGCVR